MKKILMLTLILTLASSGFALYMSFAKPITSMDIIELHTIFNDINATGQSYATTCSPVHLQVPYKQTHETTYVKLGYVPICDVNQSDYPDHAITLYCESEYVASWNYTENCEDSSYVYDYEWVIFDNENLSAVFFQSENDIPTTVFSCSFCVNDTGLIPNRTDFWIRIENTGNRIEVTNQTIEIFPQLEIVQTAINNVIILINELIEFGIALLNGWGIVIVIFSSLGLIIFYFIQLKKTGKKLVGKK